MELDRLSLVRVEQTTKLLEFYLNDILDREAFQGRWSHIAKIKAELDQLIQELQMDLKEKAS
ncbi:MAG: hypothetical protein AB7F86_09700 [Bdellovibrionales bacterium]